MGSSGEHLLHSDSVQTSSQTAQITQSVRTLGHGQVKEDYTRKKAFGDGYQKQAGLLRNSELRPHEDKFWLAGNSTNFLPEIDVAFCHIYSMEQVGCPLFFDFFSYLAVPFPPDSNVLPLFGKEGTGCHWANPRRMCALGCFASSGHGLSERGEWRACIAGSASLLHL